MRWLCAAAGLLLLGGCKPNEAPAYNGKRPPSSATYFYLPLNAINLHYEQAVDVGYGTHSLLTYDIDLNVHADEFADTVRQRLQAQGWYPVEWDLLYVDQRLTGWRMLSSVPGETQAIEDELLALCWINKKQEAFRFDLFHWRRSRTDAGPKYAVRMSHFEQPGAARMVQRYEQVYGFPWKPKPTSAPTSNPVDVPEEF